MTSKKIRALDWFKLISQKLSFFFRRIKSDKKSRVTNESSVMPKFGSNFILMSSHRKKKKRQLKKTQTVYILSTIKHQLHGILVF